MITSMHIFGSILFYMMLGDFMAKGDLKSDVDQWRTSYHSSKFCDHHDSWFYDDCKDQTNSAIQKGKDLSINLDVSAAVEIIHIYTWPDPKTYLTVNALMRGESNEHLTDQGNKQVFTEYIRLLKSSHDLVCKRLKRLCKQHDKVFRGQVYIPTDIGSYYTFESFVSTSTNIKTAQDFADQNIVFTIQGVYGLSLEEITAVPGEDEVLVKPPLIMSVPIYLTVYTQQDAIVDHIKKHKGDDQQIPAHYVEGWVVPSKPSDSGTSDVNNGPRACLLLVIVAVTFILFLSLK